MGIFSKLKGLFGKKQAAPTVKVFGRKAEDAEIAHIGQKDRRQRVLKRRVAEGKSERVYEDKKASGEIAMYFDGDRYNGSPYLEDFLQGHPYNRFGSSNVETIMYDRVTERLYVQYIKKKRWYEYRTVDQSEARFIYNAASKGVWVWDSLRVRGTRTKNKKPTSRVSGPPDHLPYKTTSGIGAAHAERKRKGLT